MPEENGNDEAQSVEITVDGKVEKLTLDQLKNDAQRWRSQGPKLQSERDKLSDELAQTKEEMKGLEEFADDFGKVLEGGDEGMAALKKMAGSIGWSEEQLENALKGEEVEEEEYSDEEDEEAPPSRTPQRTPKRVRETSSAVDASRLDPELRKDLEYARMMRLKELRQNLFGELDGVLQQDGYLSKLMTGDDGKANLISRLAQQALQRRVALERQAPGPQTFKAVAREVRDTLEGMGIQAAKDEPKGAKAFGIGEAEFASLKDEDLYRERPPEREPVTSGDYAGSVFKRLAHKIVKAGGLAKETEE